MTTYRLQRLADVDLEFDGEMLAEESTHDPAAGDLQRWQEVRIYRTSSGRWVVERTGKSSHPGEVDRPTVDVCESPAAVRAAMTFEHHTRSGTRSYVTDVCYEALRAASTVDPRLNEALIERV